MEKFLSRIEKENNAATGAPTMFMTEDGFPMTFHLIITDPSLNKQVIELIFEMGGIIDEDLKNLNSKTILLVESSIYESVRKFVRVPFKPEFVIDNAKSNKLLDLRDYLYDVCVNDTSQEFIDVIYYNVREFKPINMYPDDLSECTRIARKDAPFTSGFLSIPSTSGSSDSHQKTTKAELNIILKKLASNPQRKTYNFNRKITKKGKENAKKELKSIGTNTDDSSTVLPVKKAKKRTCSQVEEMPEVTHLSEISSKTEVAQKKIKRSSKSLSTNTDTFVPKFRKDAATKTKPKKTHKDKSSEDDSPAKSLISTVREPKHNIPSTSGGPSVETSPPSTKRRKSRRKVIVVDSSSSGSDSKSSPVRVKSSSLFSSTPTSRSKMRRNSSKKVSPLLKEIGRASVQKNLRKFKDSPEKSRVMKTLKSKFISSDSSDSDSCVKRLLRDAQRKQPTVQISRIPLSSLNSPPSSPETTKSPKSHTIRTSYIPKKKKKTETNTSVLQRKEKSQRKSTRVIKPTEKSLKVKTAENRVKKSTKSDRKTALKTNVKLSPTKKSVKTSPKVVKIKNNRRKK